ncbi:MAG: cyclic nucleotide-binding domain-containing protein, partial [Cyanobacteria bacterium J06641_5]
MSYTKTDFQNFLSLQWPFDRLPIDVQARLAGQLQPLRYRMGQPILVRDKMPNQVALLYEGKARLLGYDPVDKMPATLELIAPGGLLGWASLTRGVPCETAIAASEAIFLTFPAEAFRELCRDHPDFRRAFAERCSVAEAYELLGLELERQARGGSVDLRDLTQNVVENTAVTSIPPGRTNVGTLAKDHPLRQAWRLWLVATKGLANQEVGTPLDLQALQTLEVVGDRPLRLIGFRREDLPWLPEYAESAAAANGSSITKAAPSETDNGLSPDAIPYAERLVPSTSEELAELDDGAPRRRGKFPHVRGRTPLDSALACFQMLAQHFHVPFRREVIHRVLKDQIARSGSISLPVAGAISELMGLKAQLVNIPAKAIPRLSPPALMRWQDGLAVLYDTRASELTLGVPESGIIRRTPQAFADVWGEGGQVLLLEKTKETPQQRF